MQVQRRARDSVLREFVEIGPEVAERMPLAEEPAAATAATYVLTRGASRAWEAINRHLAGGRARSSGLQDRPALVRRIFSTMYWRWAHAPVRSAPRLRVTSHCRLRLRARSRPRKSSGASSIWLARPSRAKIAKITHPHCGVKCAAPRR